MYTIPMALADFIPVFLFGIASVILMRDLYNKMSKGAFALYAAGCIDVFAAGFLKALHKLLYAANICDFERLYVMFFPTQSIGFALAASGIIALLCAKQGKGKVYSVAPFALLMMTTAVNMDKPPVFDGTMIFIVLMVLGVAIMNGGMAIIAGKMKKPLAAVLYIVAFLMCVIMGYLGTKDFETPVLNWIAELINIGGQGSLLIATLILHKAGLADFVVGK